MPEPIIEPTTIIVESNRPRPRTNSESAGAAERRGGYGSGVRPDIVTACASPQLHAMQLPGGPNLLE